MNKQDRDLAIILQAYLFADVLGKALARDSTTMQMLKESAEGFAQIIEEMKKGPPPEK